MRRLIVHRRAGEELDEAIGYYERQKRGLGLDLLRETEGVFTKIQANPRMGSPYKATAFRYWVLNRFPYVVYYAELDESIWIVAVAHGNRRPDYWRRRRVT
jgi:toxin ParE1/3/4